MRVRRPPFNPFIFGRLIPNILEDRRREVLRREVLRLEERFAPLRPELRRRVAHPFFAARLLFALEEVRRVVVLRAVRRVAGLRREVRLRLEEPRFAARLLLEALRRRVAHAFFAARLLFALEVERVVLRLEELRFAVLLRLFLFLVAAAFFAAADRFRLFAARVLAAFLAAAERFAFVDVRRAVLRRAVVFLPVVLRVVLAILDTFFLLDFVARLPPLGGFTRVSVPRAIVQSHVCPTYNGGRHRVTHFGCKAYTTYAHLGIHSNDDLQWVVHGRTP